MSFESNSEPVRIPAVGEVVDADWAAALCRHYSLWEVEKRILQDPKIFKAWKFDGASGIPDEIFSRIFGIPSLIEIALRHDLKYGYGVIGDMGDRKQADEEFESELLADGTHPIIAKLMYSAVRAGGHGKPLRLSFSWGFARI